MDNERIRQVPLGIGVGREIDLQIAHGHHVGLGFADTGHGDGESIQHVATRQHRPIGIGTIGPGKETVRVDVCGDQLA